MHKAGADEKTNCQSCLADLRGRKSDRARYLPGFKMKTSPTSF